MDVLNHPDWAHRTFKGKRTEVWRAQEVLRAAFCDILATITGTSHHGHLNPCCVNQVASEFKRRACDKAYKGKGVDFFKIRQAKWLEETHFLLAKCGGQEELMEEEQEVDRYGTVQGSAPLFCHPAPMSHFTQHGT